MTDDRRSTIHWYECSQHGRRLVRTCPECRAETGFTEAEWDYYAAKNHHPVVVLPLPLCSHGNVKGRCPAECSRDESVTKTNGSDAANTRAAP
jgi:hypothetical protein